MATKRLSRSILEAGQRRARKPYVASKVGAERSRVKCETRVARRDPEAAEAVWIRPRGKLGHWFASDKVGAVERWLFARVGRPWREVEGEILASFDTRSVTGRHVVFEHLLPGRYRRPETGWQVNHRFVFIVDARGVLRARERESPRRPKWVRPSTEAWMAGRRIALRGAHAFWLVPVPRGDGELSYRQAARLDAQERERLEHFNSAEREAFVSR